MKNVTLKRPDMLRLYEWIKAHKAELATMSVDDATAAASSALGLTLTECILRSLCKDAEVPLRSKRVFRRTSPPQRTDKRIAFLAAQVYQLARIVDDLYSRMGEKFPADRINSHVLQQMRIGISVPNDNGKPPELFYDDQQP